MKPKCIAEYNTYMGGVDKADQMTSYYSSPSKTIHWQVKVFFKLLDPRPAECKLLIQFQVQIAIPEMWKYCFCLLNCNDSTASTSAGSALFSIGHYPVKMSRRLRFLYYSLKLEKRSQSFYCCDSCKHKKNNFVSLCIISMFQKISRWKIM